MAKALAWFREFLDDIASPGGNLMILVICVFASGAASVWVGHRDDQVDTALLSVFSGFTGALLQATTMYVRQKPEKPPEERPPA